MFDGFVAERLSVMLVLCFTTLARPHGINFLGICAWLRLKPLALHMISAVSHGASL